MAGSVQGFDEVMSKVDAYVKVSVNLGADDVKSQANVTKQAFEAQKEFLKTASGKAKPSETELCSMLKPTSDKIAAVQDFKTKHPTSAHANHLISVSEAVAALGWVAVPSKPADTVKQTKESTQFYTNRVLKEFKKENPVHGEWVEALLAVLTELENFVRKNHSGGLTWGK